MAARTKSAPGLGLLVAVLGVLVSIGMNGCDCPACPGSWQCKVRLTDVSEEVEYFFRFEVYYSGENRAALPPLASGSFIVVYQPMDPDQNWGEAREGGDRVRRFREGTRLDIYGYLDRDYDGEESSGDLAASVLGVTAEFGTIRISYLDLQPVP